MGRESAAKDLQQNTADMLSHFALLHHFKLVKYPEVKELSSLWKTC